MSDRNDYIIKHSVDARWFLALKDIKRPLLLNSYSVSFSVLEREMQKVLNYDSYNPIFEYPDLDSGAIKIAKTKLLSLKEKVCQQETNMSIRVAYVDKIEESLLEMDMMLATIENRWIDFCSLNELKFGLLKPEIVNNRISRIQEKFGLFNRSTTIEKNKLVLPSRQTIASGKKIFLGWPDLDPTNELYNSEEICALWQNEVNKFATGWRVMISDSCLYIMVNSKESKIYLPLNLSMSSIKMRGLFVHEVGTHIYRREMGKKSKLQLLSIGLAGYQMAEEGMALVREQLVEGGGNYFSGFDKYLALMYALGLIDGDKKDFRQTFLMLKSYYEMRSSQNHSLKDSKKIALRRAWGSSIRIFRGGNPSMPGCCFMRDKIYREGSIYIWELLKNSPELFADAYLGKFDPGKLKHRTLVQDFK